MKHVNFFETSELDEKSGGFGHITCDICIIKIMENQKKHLIFYLLGITISSESIMKLIRRGDFDNFE